MIGLVRGAVLACAGVLGAGTLGIGAAAFGQLPGELDTDVRKAVISSELGASVVGAVVMDPATGRALAEYNADDLFIPASNMKLFTSAVALSVLGEDFAFETRLSVLRDGGDGGGDVLVIEGGGDPGFGDPELLDAMGLTVEAFVGLWVDAAVGAVEEGGFSEVVVDDRVFDRELVHPDWPRDQLNKWYCAEVGGVNFHANLVEVYAQRTGDGLPPRVETVPDYPGVLVRNRAKSVASGRQTAWAARELGTNRLTLYGDVARSTEPIEVALTGTDLSFGALLRREIRERGVEVGPVRLARAGEDLRGAEAIHIVRTPILTALARCNSDSYNLYAEALLKRTAHEVTGAPGSWARGAAVMEMMIEPRLDVAGPSSVRVSDGSGMSRENRVSPRAVAEWLSAVSREPALSEPFTSSLASAAEGTRAVRRLGRSGLENTLRAKSGYLSGVYAMSGYLVDEETGERVVFSVLLNEKPRTVPARNVHRLFERVAGLADEWLSERTAGVGFGG